MPLRAIYRHHADDCPVNPTVGVRLPAVRGKRDRIADPSEAQALLTELESADRAVYATAMYAGLLAAWLLPSSPIARARGRGLIWWAGCALMLDWHLGMLETPEGCAVGLGAADALTLTRAWLVPAIAEAAEPTLLLLAGLTDVADGRVARATRCTRFGRDLEGLVDACFAAAALRGAVRAYGLSALPAALERARLVAGTGYVSTGTSPRAERPIPPCYTAAKRQPQSA